MLPSQGLTTEQILRKFDKKIINLHREEGQSTFHPRTQLKFRTETSNMYKKTVMIEECPREKRGEYNYLKKNYSLILPNKREYLQGWMVGCL